MTTIRSASELPTACGTLRRGVTFPDDLRLVCLWSALGLTLTGLFFALGFAAEIGQAMAAAG
jgi:hypothetical protein